MARNQVSGLAIAVFSVDEGQYYTFGQRRKGSDSPIDGNSLFEIGSITKVFTATLLAIAIDKKRAKLETPIASYLPPPLKSAPIGKISFLELATHTASLPRVPTNFLPNQNYGRQKFIDFLATWQPPSPPGSDYLYSNTGFGVLAMALSGLFKEAYIPLLNQNILKPLAMEHTFFRVPPGLNADYVQGYKPNGLPAPRWPMTAWKPGAGALRASISDMLTFLKANLGLANPTLSRACAKTHQGYFKLNAKRVQALAWLRITLADGSSVLVKDGGTSGFASYIVLAPKQRQGVVVLANKAKSHVGKLAMALMRRLLASQAK